MYFPLRLRSASLSAILPSPSLPHPPCPFCYYTPRCPPLRSLFARHKSSLSLQHSGAPFPPARPVQRDCYSLSSDSQSRPLASPISLLAAAPPSFLLLPPCGVPCSLSRPPAAPLFPPSFSSSSPHFRSLPGSSFLRAPAPPLLPDFLSSPPPPVTSPPPRSPFPATSQYSPPCCLPAVQSPCRALTVGPLLPPLP